MTTLFSILAVALGAAIGANIRWVLGVMLNAYLPNMPLGTLAANLLGGFLIGAAVALFASVPSLSAYWRLFFITGFLGGLTTFSTFSAEVFSNLQAGEFLWTLTGIFVHVAGSIFMVAVGTAAFMLLRRL